MAIKNIMGHITAKGLGENRLQPDDGLSVEKGMSEMSVGGLLTREKGGHKWRHSFEGRGIQEGETPQRPGGRTHFFTFAHPKKKKTARKTKGQCDQ